MKNIIIKCPVCDYTKQLSVGTSYLDSKYNLLNEKNENCILNQVTSEKEKNKIRSIIKHGGELKDHYGYKLYYCASCHHIYSKYYFSLGISHDQYIASYNCPVCKKQMQLLKQDQMIDYNCEKCQQDSMMYIST